MKKLILTLVLGLFVAPTLFAVPSLQLYIDGATYDGATQTWVTSATSFDLYVIGNGAHTDVRVSMALEGLAQSDDPSGASATVNGTIYPTTNWTYGYAPLSADPAVWNGGSVDLAKHGIYPAWYTEFSAGNFGTVGGVHDTQGPTPAWDPTMGYIANGKHVGEFKKYSISVAAGYGVHFDAYTYNSDGSINEFAPFSHDAATSVPEPATMLLFGLGLAGTGIVRKFRKKA